LLSILVLAVCIQLALSLVLEPTEFFTAESGAPL
jgi:hypothetical protein